MKKRVARWVLVLGALAGVFCWLKSPPLVYAVSTDQAGVSAELEKLNIRAGRSSKKIRIQLPRELSDAPWALKQLVCEKSGYDLKPYAGKTVWLTCFPTDEKASDGSRLDVWVVTEQEKIACVYKAVTAASALSPGIFPAK